MMKYYLITFGCQMNKSDSERLSVLLEALKYKKTQNIEKADLIAVVMCSVRQTAVDRVYGLKPKILKLKSQNKNSKPITILTGCVLESDKKKFLEFFDYILNIKEIVNLPQILKKRTFPKILSKKIIENKDYFKIEPKYTSKTTVFIPIMTGCNNFCSYCVVPYTRGREISRPAKEIIREAKKAIKNGAKEIWLLGQNVNSYRDPSAKSINFPKLLKKINEIKGNFKIYFLTSHPKDLSDELIQTMKKCDKFSKYLHLPIQSGDDQILKKMNRPYTVAQYKNLVKKIRKEIPDISLSTDVIVGFPGETKKHFQNTFKTLKEIGFDRIFINKYSPRAGTLASKLKDNIPWAEKKRREKILMNLNNLKKF